MANREPPAYLTHRKLHEWDRRQGRCFWVQGQQYQQGKMDSLVLATSFTQRFSSS